jgi:hypothetical protein
MKPGRFRLDFGRLKRQRDKSALGLASFTEETAEMFMPNLDAGIRFRLAPMVEQYCQIRGAGGGERPQFSGGAA